MDQSADRRVRTLVRIATERLRTCLRDAPAGSGETPYLDALVLLAHALGCTTEELFAAFGDSLPSEKVDAFNELIARRCDGIPVSYIRGVKEFYGRDFAVGPGVLVPRPDTELLVDTALELIATMSAPTEPPDSGIHLHDCCTGSGCVAVTLACERPSLSVSASDASRDACEYASLNAHRLCSVEVWCGDLLEPLNARLASGLVRHPGIITANPPYLTDNEVNDLTVRGWPEPGMALAAGPDGLAMIRRLVSGAMECLADGGYLVLEIGSEQGAAVRGLLESAGYAEVTVRRDLASRDRVCVGRWFRR
jgi:release factor glutamine methyltransferase